MYCQNCGSVLSQDARFCQSCGKPQSLPQPPSPPPVTPAPIPRTIQPQQKPRSKILWLVMGGIVLLVIIIGMLGKSPSDNSSTENSQKTESATTGPTAEEARFNALKPSEHLSQAMTALKPGAPPDQIEQTGSPSLACDSTIGSRSRPSKEPDNEANQSAASGSGATSD